MNLLENPNAAEIIRYKGQGDFFSPFLLKDYDQVMVTPTFPVSSEPASFCPIWGNLEDWVCYSMTEAMDIHQAEVKSELLALAV